MSPKNLVEILKKIETPYLFEEICDLYKKCRFKGFLGDDADMLLFQYGVFDWGNGEVFNLNLTRQFISKNDEIIQLSTTLYFQVNEVLDSFKDSSKWCNSSEELDDFANYIQNNEAYIACRSIKPINVEISYE